ncbi:MAG TPA: hypothetical protein VGJ00_10460 [Rhabdochlamydiaceae bacterium]|jgi:archaellum component FlaC
MTDIETLAENYNKLAIEYDILKTRLNNIEYKFQQVIYPLPTLRELESQVESHSERLAMIDNWLKRGIFDVTSNPNARY